MTPSWPEDFDPSAHKMLDNKNICGCNASVRDSCPRAVTGSMAYSFPIASILHQEE